jgi:adenylyltransferase/sulfurtransferase
VFSDNQIERYSRHILLKQLGTTGQQKLCDGRVLIVGAGGLGSPAALYCAAAGVGTIGIIDYDRVELSNLQRQIIHAEGDIGRLKAESAADSIRAINADVCVQAYTEKFAVENARLIVREYDFVIDGTDNFGSKFLVNDACVHEGKPFSHAGVLQFSGQTLTVVPGKSACYRCVFEDLPPKDAVPSCSQAGVLSSVVGILGSIQATEALKYLAQIGELLTDCILTFDALSMEFRKITVRRNPECLACGSNGKWPLLYGDHCN